MYTKHGGIIQRFYLPVKYKLKLCFVLSEWPSQKNQLTTHAGVYAREGIVHSTVRILAHPSILANQGKTEIMSFAQQ